MKISSFIISVVLCFAPLKSVLACEGGEKPELTIEIDEIWHENADFCADYTITFTSKFNKETFSYATIDHGSGKNMIQLALRSSNNYVETDDGETTSDGTNSIYICASPEWFKDVKLTLHYKYPSEGGWVLACHPMYHYENLTQWIQ